MKLLDGDLNASTSGGNVSLHNLTCALKAGTSGGNIDVSVKTLTDHISLHNSSGRVNLSIPKNTGVDLKLSAMKISTGSFENFNGSKTDEEIKGTLNGGGVPVTLMREVAK